MNLKSEIESDVFYLISDAAVELNQKSYLIGGFVRDLLMGNVVKDIDVVTVGSGISLAQKVAELSDSDPKIHVYKNFGTAMLKIYDYTIEFVGARKESYNRNSRKPVVEDGTISDDQKRRDFTINALAISLNPEDYGDVTDPFNGIEDIKSRIIKTPLDPELTFSDDPLRMLRAVRFATQLNFNIEKKTYEAVKNQKQRLEILSKERIIEELNKILMADKPSIGINLLDDTGLLSEILPEISALKGVEFIDNIGHKDNYLHTLEVLDNLASETDDLWLRWSALLHDVAKPVTIKFNPDIGWTFYGHEHVGAKMAHRIFKRLKLPLNEPLKFVQKMINLHLRPIALVENSVTDSAVRRLLFDAGDDIDKLMLLCKADITSKNEYKKNRYKRNFEIVEQKLIDIEEKDKIRNWQPPVTGDIIMETFGIEPGKEVGIIKTAIREAILDGVIPNDFEEAYKLMIEEGKKLGLTVEKKKKR